MDLIDTENHNQQNQEELKARIKHLEDIINRAHLAFFSDSSDRKVSIAMHRILDEEVRKESKP
jgi:transcription elongation GreA/GreB family factor